MFKTKSKDHSRIYLKVLLRKSFLELGAVEKNVALDLFSGKGEIAKGIYLDFKEVHLVEKNPKQFEILKGRFSRLPQARLWKMENLKFLKNELPNFSELSLVDFDAYGSPNQQILFFFASWKLKTPLLVFATDGGILAGIRGRSFSPDRYLAGLSPNCASEPGQESATGYDRVLNRNYERMIRCFWDELAKRHCFKIELFKIIWKKGGQVAYYGLLIKPR